MRVRDLSHPNCDRWLNPQLRKLDEAELCATLNQYNILPLIQDVPLSRLQHATGLSLRYVSLIRRGKRVPHPRHWQAFLGVTGVG